MEYYYEYESDLEFIKKALSILYHSAICFIFHLILLMMPLIMAYTGVKNLMNCPKQPKVPLYLFVFGLFGLVKLLQNVYDLWRIRRKDNFDQGMSDIVDDEDATGGITGPTTGSGSKCIDGSITLFLIIWFGFGNYWVFSIYKPRFKQPADYDSMNWCSEQAYMTAVYHIFAVYGLTAAFLLILLLVVIYSKCCRVKVTEEDLNNAETAEA